MQEKTEEEKFWVEAKDLLYLLEIVALVGLVVLMGML